jgi:negative regulator of flagellin synthesis FlgM
MTDMTNPIQQNARALGLDLATDSRVRKADDAKSAAAKEASASADTPARADEVVLSDIRERAAAASDFDAEKVQAIKEAIRDGRYPIDAKAIAQHFMALESTLSRVS